MRRIAPLFIFLNFYIIVSIPLFAQLKSDYNQELKDKNLQEKSKEAYNKGNLLTEKGDYKNALSYFKKSIYKGIDKSKLIEIYLGIGNAHFYSDNNKLALLYYEKELQIAKEVKNVEYIAIGNLNIALIKKRLGQFEEALEIEKKILTIAKGITFTKPATHYKFFVNIGGTYLNLNKPDSTIYYCKKGLEKSNAIGDKIGDSYFYNLLGAAYYDKKDFTSSLNYYHKAIDIVISSKNSRRLIATHYLIAKTLFSLKKYDEALLNLGKAEKYNDSTQNFISEELIETYKLSADIYSLKNDTNKSNYYFQKYASLDSLNDVNRAAIINDLYAKDIQKKSNALIKVSNKNKSFKNIIFVCLTLLCLVLIGLLIQHKKSQKDKQRFLELLNSTKLKTTNKKLTSKTVTTNNINLIKTKDILTRLEEMEQEEFFLSTEFGLNELAKKLKTNSNYLSKVIKTHRHKKFTDYTNELRINYALKRLKNDSRFRSYSILHIAKELGYKSQDSFSRHFKKITGIYPSYYISSINKLKTSSVTP